MRRRPLPSRPAGGPPTPVEAIGASLGHDGRVTATGRILLTCVAGCAAVMLAACATPTGGSGDASPTGTGATGSSGAPGSATPDPSGPSPQSSGTGGPGGGEPAVLTIRYVGGLVPPMMRESVPAISLWRDGFVVQPGAQIAIYPPPALPAVMSAQVEAAAMPGVLDTVAAGLDGLPDDFGYPPTADVPATVVTWRADGGEQVWTAASLGVGDDVPSEGVTEEQVRAREQLTRVVDYAQAVAAGGVEGVPVSAQQPYAVPAWYVWSAPFQESGEPAPEPVRWPGPPLTGSETAWGCQVVTGEDVAVVTEALTTAVATTPWKSGGSRWTVVVRPVLPGEPDTCPE